MDTFLLTILTSISISTNVLLADDLCRHYDDKSCVHHNALKNGHYVNQWSVYVPGMAKAEARQMFEENGFIYLGQVMDDIDLYLVTKLDTTEKHAMPNEEIIESLKKLHELVQSVAQRHVLKDSKDILFSVSEIDELNCQTLDPNTIRLNDGSENLSRIQAAQTDNQADKPTSTQYRPTSSTNISDDEVVEKHSDDDTERDEA